MNEGSAVDLVNSATNTPEEDTDMSLDKNVQKMMNVESTEDADMSLGKNKPNNECGLYCQVRCLHT